MKNIKKVVLSTILFTAFAGQSLYADQATQNKIRHIVEKHQPKLITVKSSNDLKNFLKPLLQDLKSVLKDAPNTNEYKALKEAVNKINVDQIITVITNLKTILKHLDPDIQETITKAIPAQFRLILML